MTITDEMIERAERFNRGDRVAKTGGDYTFSGRIVTTFYKFDSGEERVIVQDHRGLLLIMNPKQLVLETALQQEGGIMTDDRWIDTASQRIAHIKVFDEEATANQFLSEDGEGGFAAGVHRMAKEIERLQEVQKSCHRDIIRQDARIEELEAERDALKELVSVAQGHAAEFAQQANAMKNERDAIRRKTLQCCIEILCGLPTDEGGSFTQADALDAIHALNQPAKPSDEAE